MLKENDLAPQVSSLDQDSNPISLSGFKGKKIALYFYPKDNTPGCTIESCGFRDAHEDFKKLGVTVIGVSRDSAKKHQNFIAKHSLPFPLIADVDSALCDAFGVIKEKSMFGKKYKGVERSTFLINEEGRIVRSWPKVKIAGHVEEVLEAAKSL